MRDSGEEPDSPPVTFPVYGLDASWAGARWLDTFGDSFGQEVHCVRLGHQDLATGAEVMVETWSGPLTDDQVAAAETTAPQALAFAAANLMVNLTMPWGTVPEPMNLLRVMHANADEQARRHAEWAPVSWRVDGADIPARAWRFADGWAAFSDAVAGVYLIAAGSGTGPEGLALAALPDGSAYHFALDQPLGSAALDASRAARAGGDELPPPGRVLHADHLRLLNGRS